MNVAFSLWENRIAPVFDVAGELIIAQISDGCIVQRFTETLPRSAVERAVRLVELGVDELVCGAISRSLKVLIVGHGIRVTAFVAGDLEAVSQAWLSGSLVSEAFSMPGCCKLRCREHRARRLYQTRRRRPVKVAFTSSGDSLAAPLNPRFGRAPVFVVYDLENDTFDVLDNKQNLSAVQGAGVQAAETLARSGADCLVTGHCGPKAFRVLNAAGIEVYTCSAGTVVDALNAFRSGELSAASFADVDGQW